MKVVKYSEAFAKRPLFLPVFTIQSIPKSQQEFMQQHGIHVGAQVVGLSDNGFFIKTVNGRPAIKFTFPVLNLEFVKHESFPRSMWVDWLEHRNESPAPEEKKAPKVAKAKAAKAVAKEPKKETKKAKPAKKVSKK